MCNTPTRTNSSQREAGPTALVWPTKTISDFQGAVTNPAKVVQSERWRFAALWAKHRRFIKDFTSIPGTLHLLTQKAGSERPRREAPVMREDTVLSVARQLVI